MNDPLIKELVYIPIKDIQITNTHTDRKLIKRIAKHLDWELFMAVPAFWDGHTYILTDGNHRVQGAKLAGYKQVPAILLTQAEFDYVAFSKRQLHFLVTR